MLSSYVEAATRLSQYTLEEHIDATKLLILAPTKLSASGQTTIYDDVLYSLLYLSQSIFKKSVYIMFSEFCWKVVR